MAYLIYDLMMFFSFIVYTEKNVPHEIFTQNVDTERQEKAVLDAQQIAQTLQEAQILYAQASWLVQIAPIEPHQERPAHLWRRPRRAHRRVGEENGMQTVGPEEDCQQGRGGLLFVGIQAEPDPAVVG